MGNVSEGFARQADVVLVVEGEQLLAHSQYLSSHSRLFEHLLDAAEDKLNRSEPLRLESPLARHVLSTSSLRAQHCSEKVCDVQLQSVHSHPISRTCIPASALCASKLAGGLEYDQPCRSS